MTTPKEPAQEEVKLKPPQKIYDDPQPEKNFIVVDVEEYSALQQELSTLRAEKGKIAEEAWVSVEERLPEPDKRLPSVSQVVLIHTDKLTPWFGYYDFSIKLWLTTSNVFRNVTHWQPLPKPPSSIEQKKEEKI